MTNWIKTVAFALELSLDSSTDEIWNDLIDSSPSRIDLFDTILSTISLLEFGSIGSSLLLWFKHEQLKIVDKKVHSFNLIFEFLTSNWTKRTFQEFNISPEPEQHVLLTSIDKIILECQELKETLAIFPIVIEKFIQFKQELQDEENN